MSDPYRQQSAEERVDPSSLPILQRPTAILREQIIRTHYVPDGDTQPLPRYWARLAPHTSLAEMLFNNHLSKPPRVSDVIFPLVLPGLVVAFSLFLVTIGQTSTWDVLLVICNVYNAIILLIGVLSPPHGYHFIWALLNTSVPLGFLTALFNLGAHLHWRLGGKRWYAEAWGIEKITKLYEEALDTAYKDLAEKRNIAHENLVADREALDLADKQVYTLTKGHLPRLEELLMKIATAQIAIQDDDRLGAQLLHDMSEITPKICKLLSEPQTAENTAERLRLEGELAAAHNAFEHVLRSIEHGRLQVRVVTAETEDAIAEQDTTPLTAENASLADKAARH